jgi:hypothetical protein
MMGGTTREPGPRIRGTLVIAGWLRRAGRGDTRVARRGATRIAAALLRGSRGGEAVRARCLLPVPGSGMAGARVPVRERPLRVLPVGERSGWVLPLGILAGRGLSLGICPRREPALRVGASAERVLRVLSGRVLIRTVLARSVRDPTIRAWNWLSGAGLSGDELTRAAHPRRVLTWIRAEVHVPGLARPERHLAGRHLAELPSVRGTGMRHLPVLPGGVLALRVLDMMEMVLGALAQANWRLPVLAGRHWARMHWAGLACGARVAALLAGGVRDATLLRLAIWPLTVRSLVVLRRAIWPWAEARAGTGLRGGLSPRGELPSVRLPGVELGWRGLTGPERARIVLPGTVLPGTVLPGTELPGTELLSAVLSRTVLSRTVLTGAEWPGRGVPLTVRSRHEAPSVEWPGNWLSWRGLSWREMSRHRVPRIVLPLAWSPVLVGRPAAELPTCRRGTVRIAALGIGRLGP